MPPRFAARGDRGVSWRWRARFGQVYRRPGVSRDGRTLFVPSADRHLYALDAGTGLVGWRFAAGAPVLSQPLVTPELVVFTAGERLLAVHAASGKLAWAVPGRGTALFTTERGLLSRVGLADGDTVWQADLGVGVQNAGLAVAGDSAWVVAVDGRLVRVRLADGREQGSVRYTSARCYSAPAIVGDTLVTGDQDGVVHGIRLPAGLDSCG